MKGMKRKLTGIVAVILSLTLCLGVGAACGNGNASEAVSYVAVEVNPSVSMTLDKNNRVLSVIADNQDAQVMLYNEEIVGLEVEEALDKIAELSVELGYLNDANVGVDVLVSGKADEESILAAAEQSFKAHAGDLDVNFASEGTFELQRELKSVKAEYASDANVQGMDLVKFRLVLEAKKVDGSLSISAAAEMDSDELIAIIEKGAEKILPYATAAYNTAVNAAERIYNDAKGQLIDSIWIVPYTKDLANIITGERKYDVNYGLIYNLYTSSSRVLAIGLDAAEAAAEAARATGVSDTVLENIETALPEADRQAFRDGVDADKDGKVTLYELDLYFNTYFKNMTADEREAAKQVLNDIIDDVNEFASEIDASIAEEYKAAAERLYKDLTALIPDSIKDTADKYMQEFSGLLTDISNAISGKEPMAAAYAAKAAIDARAADIMETMRGDLTKEDLEDVEKMISDVNGAFAKAEETYKNAVEQAKETAREFLESLKAERTQAE